MSIPGSSDKQHKYSRIKTDLVLKILRGELPPKQKIPTLDEIAEQYQVSLTTARRVLNDLVAEGMVYSVRGRGSFVVEGAVEKQHQSILGDTCVAAVFSHSRGNFMGGMIAGIDDWFHAHRTHLLIKLSKDSYEREADILKRLKRQGIRRIILRMAESHSESRNPNIPLYFRLQEEGIQLLLIEFDLPDLPIPSFVFDDRSGIEQLVEYVVSQNCRNLVYVTRNTNATSIRTRLVAFKEMLLEENLPYSPNHIISVSCDQSKYHHEHACNAVLELLATNDKPDAILCSDEEVAAGVFKAINLTPAIGWDDVLVGGFGNQHSVELSVGLPYILINQNTFKMGQEAAKFFSQDKSQDSMTPMTDQTLHQLLPYSLSLPEPGILRTR